LGIAIVLAYEEEEDHYRSKDCLETFKAKILEDETATKAELETIDQQILDKLEEAVKFADDSPWPAPEEVTTDVYVNYP